MSDEFDAERDREAAITRIVPDNVSAKALLQHHDFAVDVAGLQQKGALGDRAMLQRTIEHHFPEHRTYTREQLRDPRFYEENREHIQRAVREGRIRA